jgi:hypothetical protein
MGRSFDAMRGSSEGQRLADEKADEIEALSWEELDAYDERDESITTASGSRLRVRSGFVGLWRSGRPG